MNKFLIFRKTFVAWFIQLNCILLAVVMALNPVLASNFKPIGIKETESTKFAASLGRGWNLGNTFDACKDDLDSDGNSIQLGNETETLWGNPETTKELFEYVKASGFDFVRIPVTWKNHFKAESGYPIDKAWLDRVQQVVDWSLECELKVILNTHHDSTTGKEWSVWYVADNAHYDTTKAILTSLWSQIAERFKEYDNNLIFEILNEPGYAAAKYGGHGNDESRYVLGKLNLDALEAIRAVGGENESRFVMLPTHGAVNGYEPNSAIVLPDDPHVLVSVHAYINTGHEMSDVKYKLNVWKNMLMIQKFFLNKGYGTVIGEFGEMHTKGENNTFLDPIEDKDIVGGIADDCRYYMEIADKFGVSCCYWDDGGWMRLLNRRTMTWEFPQIVNALTGYTA